MVRVPFLLCVILKLVHHQRVPFRYWLPKKASGIDLDKNMFFSRRLQKEFELEKKTVKFQFSGEMWIPDYY